MDSPATVAPVNHQSEAIWLEGLRDSLLIVISYIPVAFAFGLNATKLGFTPLESLFFSCIICAGASLFVITALLAAGSSLWVAAFTVMAMDVRHVLYGPSLRSRIAKTLSKTKIALWAFGLTNKVFPAATAKLVRGTGLGASTMTAALAGNHARRQTFSADAYRLCRARPELYKTRSIILPTLLGVLDYGLTWKFMMVI